MIEAGQAWRRCASSFSCSGSLIWAILLQKNVLGTYTSGDTRGAERPLRGTGSGTTARETQCGDSACGQVRKKLEGGRGKREAILRAHLPGPPGNSQEHRPPPRHEAGWAGEPWLSVLEVPGVKLPVTQLKPHGSGALLTSRHCRATV